jgi:hypothetical protein
LLTSIFQAWEQGAEGREPSGENEMADVHTEGWLLDRETAIHAREVKYHGRGCNSELTHLVTAF